jgi:hypothetical protein
MDRENLSLSQFNFNFNFVSLMKTVAKPPNLKNGVSLLIIFILNIFQQSSSTNWTS